MERRVVYTKVKRDQESLGALQPGDIGSAAGKILKGVLPEVEVKVSPSTEMYLFAAGFVLASTLMFGLVASRTA